MIDNVAFPMYDVNPAATDALAAAVLRRFPAAHFQRPADLLSHWQDDNLLLSQTCGYPLMTALEDVQVVDCFHYTAPGCEGRNYRSGLVARQTESGKTLTALREGLAEIASEAEIAAPLLIGGFSPASRRDYDVILKASSCV